MAKKITRVMVTFVADSPFMREWECSDVIYSDNIVSLMDKDGKVDRMIPLRNVLFLKIYREVTDD